jgi:hypothetical protein
MPRNIAPQHLRLQRITPAQAKALLSNQHEAQRPKSAAWVGILENRIRRGQWDPAANMICVDECGRLTDGGQRCAAIVAANTPVMAYVVAMPWSTYRDDTRRRSLADRHSVSKQMAAVSRLAGRIVGKDDPDEALKCFGRWVVSYGLDAVPKTKPWGCAAAVVGALGVELSGVRQGAALLRRLSSVKPENRVERSLCIAATRGHILTTGGGQWHTALAVFRCGLGVPSADMEGLRSVLQGCCEGCCEGCGKA